MKDDDSIQCFILKPFFASTHNLLTLLFVPECNFNLRKIIVCYYAKETPLGSLQQQKNKGKKRFYDEKTYINKRSLVMLQTRFCSISV